MTFKETFEDFKTDGKTFVNFIIRNIFWFALIGAGLFVLGMTTSLLNVTFTVVYYEGLALGLSGTAAFVFTKNKFADNNSPTLGHIFLGCHVLVGLVVAGAYFIQMNNPMDLDKLLETIKQQSIK